MMIEQLVETLIERLTIPNLEDLLIAMDEAPGVFYDTLCKEFSTKYPNAAEKFFNEEAE